MSSDRDGEELEKIFETLSFTEDGLNFMGSVSELDVVNVDSEAIEPQIIKKPRLEPTSPFASRDARNRTPLVDTKDLKRPHILDSKSQPHKKPRNVQFKYEAGPSRPSVHSESITARQQESHTQPQHEKFECEQIKQDQKQTYKKTFTTIDGQLCEIRLSTLLLLRGLSEKCDDFYLASNMKEAHNFDDVVFKYGGAGRSKIIFLQSKHRQEGKENTEKNRVTINKLFSKSEKEVFSLKQYFRKYLEIRRKFSKGKEHPIFGNEFEDLDCDFIIYTNAAPVFNTNKGGVRKLEERIVKVDIEKDSVLNFAREDTLEGHSYYKIDPEIVLDKYIKEKVDVLRNVENSNDDDIMKFLSSLKLFVGQPSQNHLGEVIKREVQRTYGVLDQDINSVLCDIESRVRTWWDKENYYLTKENRFFQDAIRISIGFDVKEPVTLFTGREEELSNLHSKIQRSSGKATVISQMTSISGLGGIGKTELARKYISEHSQDYDGNVIWITAENEATLFESFDRLAKDRLTINTKDANGEEKDIKSIVGEVYKFFDKRKSLFIFDNAEKNEFLNKFLPLRSLAPDTNKPYILITSRNREWEKGMKVMNLNELRLKDAINLVKKGLSILQEDKTQDQEIESLVEKLQRFPLAIQQAMVYIEDQRVVREFGIDDYIKEYEKKTEYLLQSDVFKGIDNDYAKTTFTTWKITIDKIKSNEQYGDLALAILDAIAYLAPEKINREMFLSLAEDDEETLRSAVRLLIKFSMVNGEDKQSVLSIHRLVQEVIRLELKKQSKDEEVVKIAFNLLKESFPYGKRLEDYAKMRQLLPHFEAFLSNIDDWIKQNSAKKQITEKTYIERLLARMGSAYSILGNPLRQKELLERALAIKEKHYGLDHFEVAGTLVNLGDAYWSLGDPQKLKDVTERALAIKEKHYGYAHFEIATTLASLGNAYGAFGDYQNQKELLERSLAIKEKHYESDHFEVAITLLKLGNANGDFGDYQKKKKLLERALPILENQCGRGHFDLVFLGNAYGDLGDLQKKRKILERALVIQEKHYGPDHFKVAKTLVKLGSAYRDLYDPQKGKELLKRSLPILENHFGPDHFEIAITLVNLGNAYGNLADHQKKRELLERALVIQEKHYGHDHCEVAKTLVSLCVAYGNLGDYQKQIELFKRAIRNLENQYDGGIFNLAIILVFIGNAFGDLGDLHQKRKILENALGIQKKHYGHDHFEVAETLANLGRTYGALCDPQKERELLERSLSISENHFGPDHFVVAKLLANLGNAYGNLGNDQKNKELLERALAIEEKHYGPDHFEVAITLSHLGNAYGDLGAHQKKRKLLERALVTIEKHYSHDHCEEAETLVNLCVSYGDLGYYQKQKELIEWALPILENHYGPYHFNVAPALVSLGNAYGFLGDHQKQKGLLERALAINEIYYGRNNFEVAISLVNLGSSYGALGDLQKQKELYERALPILENHCGPDNFRVAMTVVNLGNAYGALADPQKQKELLERALAIQEKYYGPDHFEVSKTLVHLGFAYGALCDPQKKRELLERALPILENHFGPDHFVVAIILVSLGNAYRALYDAEKEKYLLKRALSVFERIDDVLFIVIRFLSAELCILVVKTLVADGSDVLARHNHQTVLHHAVSSGNEEVIRLILEKIKEKDPQNIYDNINSKDAEGDTPLMWAAQKGKSDAAKILQEYGADLNAQNYDGETALHWATKGVYQDFVQLLLDTKADPNIQDNNRRTPLALACGKLVLDPENDDLQAIIVLLLIGTYKLMAYEENHLGPDDIKVVIKLASLSIVFGVLGDAGKRRALLNRVLPSFERHELPLITVINTLTGEFRTLVVKTLVEEGSDILARNYHHTVIHQAVSSGNEDIIRLILEKIKEKVPQNINEHVNPKDTEGDTPLMWAAQNGKTHAAQILLEYGADLNAQNNDGETALHWATKGGYQDFVQLLLDTKADPNIQDNNGKTPLALAYGKLALDPENDDLILITVLLLNVTDKPLAQLQEEQGLGLVSLVEYLPGPSSGNRRK